MDGGGGLIDCLVGCNTQHPQAKPCREIQEIAEGWMPKAAPPITASDRPLCDHCHKLGQTSDRRFKNHPELVRCTTCKKFGHFHYACTAAVARTTSTSAGLGRPVIEMTDDGRRTIARYICEQFDHGVNANSRMAVAGR